MITNRTKEGLQSEIRQLTEAMNRLCEAMKSLPDSLKDQYGDKIVQDCIKTHKLINDLSEISPNGCYYGFTKGACTGGNCCTCTSVSSSNIRWN